MEISILNNRFVCLGFSKIIFVFSFKFQTYHERGEERSLIMIPIGMSALYYISTQCPYEYSFYNHMIFFI